MNLQWKRFILTAALPVGMAVMAPAQAAFIVDDFEVTTPVICQDSTGGGNTCVGSPSTEGTVMGGDTAWSRSLHANLAAGDSVQTEDCNNCKAGHVVGDAGVDLSVGTHFFDWEGPSKDLSDTTGFLFDWSSDLSAAGMEAFAVFFDDAGSETSATITLSADPSFTTYSIALPDLSGTGGAGYADITRIELWFDGSNTAGNGVDPGGYDANIDNVRMPVPEPSILALLSIGLVGLGWQRRRRRV